MWLHFGLKCIVVRVVVAPLYVYLATAAVSAAAVPKFDYSESTNDPCKCQLKKVVCSSARGRKI